MKRYKLTTQDMTTHAGHKWKIGVEQVIDEPGNTLCSDQVFHFYDSPEVAVLLNPAHANIANPLLWEVSCDEVAHDGTKGGAKHMTLTKKVKAPRFTELQKQVFAIKCALAVYKDMGFKKWANGFLSGKDRTAARAADAARAAYAADAARASYATYAARASYATYAAVAARASYATYAARASYATYAAVAARASYASCAAVATYAAYAAANTTKIRKVINSAAKFAANFKG